MLQILKTSLYNVIVVFGQTKTLYGVKMKFNQIIAPSMKELFIKEIEALILSGQLKVGEKLPTERELADEMKISRTIVNLGLSELKNKGFIDIVPRKGAFVADYSRNGKLDTLISIINFNGGRFDKKTVNSIMEFRRINEGEGTYLATKYRTDEDVAELKSILNEVRNCDDPMEIAQKLFKFHHVILCASGNNIFPLVYNAFETFFLKLISSLFAYCDKNSVIDGLENLVVAIEQQDCDEAKRQIEQILSSGIEVINKRCIDYSVY